MNLIEAYKLAINYFRERKDYADYNSEHMDVIWYKQKLKDEAIEYAEAERLMKEEMEKNKDGRIK